MNKLAKKAMNLNRVIRIGLLGLGTVGTGTVNVLQRNARDIERKLGCVVQIRIASVRDLTAERHCDCEKFEITSDPYLVVNHPEVDIVVELIGGENLAKELVLAAIAANKPVVTANKALIALHGNEVFAAAESQGVAVFFEAAVAGGISIIKSLREGLVGNRVQLVAGIINGTSNFILTEMRDKGRSFTTVLAQAQDLGYAEADPKFDIEGVDAAHKLAILAALAFGMPLAFEEVYIEGITGVELTDITYAQELGYRIKHLGIAKLVDGEIELRVHPTLIPKSRLIANVEGVMNAVLVHGDAVGPTLHYGAGAGAEPTASAVIADIVDASRAILTGASTPVPQRGFQAGYIVPKRARKPENYTSAYYLRVNVSDVPGVMSKLSTVFANLGVSIEAITQKEPAMEEQNVSVIFITQRTQEKLINQAIAEFNTMPEVQADITRIRVEHFND